MKKNYGLSEFILYHRRNQYMLILPDSKKASSGREHSDSAVTRLKFSIVDIHCHSRQAS